MTKKQQRTENLNRHYFSISQLYQQTTGKEITQDQAKKISNKLRKLEKSIQYQEKNLARLKMFIFFQQSILLQMNIPRRMLLLV